MLLTACSIRSVNPTRRPGEPVAGDADLNRGEVSLIDKESRWKQAMHRSICFSFQERYPPPAINCALPFPGQMRRNQIYVETYSVFDPSEICIQVLESFEENIPLGSFSSGSPDNLYSVREWPSQLVNSSLMSQYLR